MHVIPSEEHILRELEQIRDQARQLNATLDAIYTQLLDLEQRAYDGQRVAKPASKPKLLVKAQANPIDT